MTQLMQLISVSQTLIETSHPGLTVSLGLAALGPLFYFFFIFFRIPSISNNIYEFLTKAVVIWSKALGGFAHMNKCLSAIRSFTKADDLIVEACQKKMKIHIQGRG